MEGPRKKYPSLSPFLSFDPLLVLLNVFKQETASEGVEVMKLTAVSLPAQRAGKRKIWGGGK